MSNFRFIEYDIDVSNILADIKDKDWGVAGTLKGASGDTKPYGFLPLTMAMVKHAGDDPKKTELQINTPMFKTYKGIRRWLKSWKLHQHSRAAFFKLRPGESLGRHIDERSEERL